MKLLESWSSTAAQIVEVIQQVYIQYDQPF